MRTQRLKRNWHWVIIVILLLLGWGLFIYHLLTQWTPSREAFTIPVLNVPVYWYGICIVVGIGLGATVVARLAQERAAREFLQTVPVAVRQRTLTQTQLPDDLQSSLQPQVKTLGELLLRWGMFPAELPLEAKQMATLEKSLLQEPDVAQEWITQPSWRAWSPDHVWNGLIICVIFGVIGARLYHVLTPPPSMAAVGITSPLDYFRNPGQLINLRNGGLGIYGGLVGGALGLAIYTWRRRLPLWGWADLAVVGMALGQVIGRWGNFFNQELYGRPTAVPWALYVDPAHRLLEYAEFEQFHPAFLYESLWSLLAFIVLYWLARKHAAALMRGELTALYLIFYAIGRTLLETVRLDSRTVMLGNTDLAIPIATVVSLSVAIIAAGWIAWRRWRRW